MAKICPLCTFIRPVLGTGWGRKCDYLLTLMVVAGDDGRRKAVVVGDDAGFLVVEGCVLA